MPKTDVFGEPRRFADICFWCPKLLFLESPEGFLAFFWYPQLMVLESPEGLLTYVFGAQNSYLWRAQKMSWLLFLFSKTHIFGASRRFPDICCWCPKLMFLESPEGFLTFVLGAQNSRFWRVQKISWHLFLVPKTHVFGAPRRFSLFLVPKTHVFREPMQKVSWHLLLAPKTHVFGEPRRFPAICLWCPNFMFFESPEGFLTFDFGAQNSCFWRAQKVSWHLFLVPKTHVSG